MLEIWGVAIAPAGNLRGTMGVQEVVLGGGNVRTGECATNLKLSVPNIAFLTAWLERPDVKSLKGPL